MKLWYQERGHTLEEQTDQRKKENDILYTVIYRETPVAK